MDPGGRVQWVSDTHVRVADTDYDLMEAVDPGVARLRMLKTRSMIEGYLPLIGEFQGGNICEIGIYRGGSTAFFAQVLEPNRLVAVEFDEQRVAILDDFLDGHDSAGSVRLHYGVDQSDRARLDEIIASDLGGAPLDLVIDDASHVYGPTRASFEVLFPRLRPGGLYLIEDWRPHQDYLNLIIGAFPDRSSPMSAHLEESLGQTLADPSSDASRLFSAWCARTIVDPTAHGHQIVADWYRSISADESSSARSNVIAAVQPLIDGAEAGTPGAVIPTLTTLAAELLLGAASGHPSIGELTLNPYWIAVRRGPAQLEPTFAVDQIATDFLGTLASRAPLSD